MAYVQVKRFDQSKAGNTKGYCLRNVRLGYGIAAKYDSAWESWQNAPQNGGEIPTGVDVPVYFWYGRYGHIGVRLANGRFWSDGKIYSSLTVYRITHPAVIYRGWSTEVNDVTVIKYEAPKPTPVPPTPSKMPPVGSRVTFSVPRTAFVSGTTTVKGTLPPDVRIVRGYDPIYQYRILVNSSSVGNGVAVALYLQNGKKIDGWKQL